MWVSLYYFSLPRVNLQLVQDKKYNCEIADLIKRSVDETVWASPLPWQEAGWSGVPDLSRPSIFFPMLAALSHPDLQVLPASGLPTPSLLLAAGSVLHKGLLIPHEDFRMTNVFPHLLLALLGSR